jgi:hypothetical protein
MATKLTNSSAFDWPGSREQSDLAAVPDAKGRGDFLVESERDVLL